MNNPISDTLKKLTICLMVLIFSFILLAPTADALNYDPKKRKAFISPDGDIDPWEENDVIDPPPEDNNNYLNFSNILEFKIGFASYLIYKLGWYSNTNWRNNIIDDTPIKDINITTLDYSENNSKQTIRNR